MPMGNTGKDPDGPASMAPMTLLKVDPPALIRFKVDKTDTESQRSIITIENTGSDAAAYKLKTTAPDAFGLKPNTGTVKPGEKAQVQVLLQLKGIEKAHNARFQIQAVKVDDTSAPPTKEMWTAWSKEPKRVQEHLLTVLCEDAKGGIVGGRAAPASLDLLKSMAPGQAPNAKKSEDLQTYALALERDVKLVQEHVLRLKQVAEHIPQSKQRAIAAGGAVFVLSRMLRRRANHASFFALLLVMMRDGAFAAAIALAFALGQQRKLRAVSKS